MKKFVIALLLLCAMSAAEELPKIAVHVTGSRNAGESRALTTFILAALIKSGKYEAVERSEDFVTQINRELETQHSGIVDDNQIRRLGMQAGVQFVCVADITKVLGAYQMSARIINVETAKVIAIGVASSDMESIEEMEILANDIVAKMLGLKSANQVLGESEKDKRLREKADADRRKKMEIERRKREEAREREEAAVRREREKADRAERREQEKAEKKKESAKAEDKECSDYFGLRPCVEDGGVWEFYASSFPILPIWFRLGVGSGIIGTYNVEIEGIVMFRKENGYRRGWEPRIDLATGLYRFDASASDSGNFFFGLTAFKGWTLINNSDAVWERYFGYGAAVYLGGGYGTGFGLGGQAGLERRLFDGAWVFNLDVRPMYRIIITGKGRGHYLGGTVGLSFSIVWGKLGSDRNYQRHY